mmetsp:Transcript_18923/g.50696  ORF Transcript_18923/g.50696 Transcript_18923/m.50696 type:complete len:476 (-) Transcript_18923:343-1770(-)
MRRHDLSLQLHGGEERDEIPLANRGAHLHGNINHNGLNGSLHRHLLVAASATRSTGAGRGFRCRSGSQGLAVAFHEGEEHLILDEFRVLEDTTQERHVRLDALNVVPSQGVDGLFASGLEGGVSLARGEADQFPHKGIIVHAGLTTLVQRTVNAHTLSLRLAVDRHLLATARSQGKPRLDGGTSERRCSLIGTARKIQVRQSRAACDSQLRFHDVDACDLLSDRVLDLDARVHLHENEAYVGIIEIASHHEFHGAHILVSTLPHEPECAVRELGSELRVHPRWCHLHDLLVSLLDAAVPLVEVCSASLTVSYNLNLDVTSTFHELLEEDGTVAKGSSRLARAPVVRIRKLSLAAHHAHAAASSAERCLEDDGVRDLVVDEELRGFLSGGKEARTAQDRDATALGQLSRLHLVTQERNGLRRRSHETHTSIRTSGSKLGAFAEEAVAWMYGLCSAFLNRIHDTLHIQVWCNRTWLG